MTTKFQTYFSQIQTLSRETYVFTLVHQFQTYFSQIQTVVITIVTNKETTTSFKPILVKFKHIFFKNLNVHNIGFKPILVKFKRYEKHGGE